MQWSLTVASRMKRNHVFQGLGLESQHLILLRLQTCWEDEDFPVMEERRTQIRFGESTEASSRKLSFARQAVSRFPIHQGVLIEDQ